MPVSLLPSKILVGVDFSAESDAAVHHAMGVARMAGAKVVLLHACSVPDLSGFPAQGGPPALAHYRELLEADLRANRQRLEELRSRLGGQGVEVSHVFADGFPDSLLADKASELDADLIVVGTHGRTGLKWLFLGSVARRVVRLADRSVLVARGEASRGGYRRICVATDFSPSAERALAQALDLAGKDARVDVVHLWHLPPQTGPSDGMAFSLPNVREELGAELRASGERLVAAHRRPGVVLSFEAIYAPPLPGLVQHLENGSYDLVALGSHGRRGIRRFILGSVAEATASRAPCSTLVVHGGEVA